MTAAMRVSATLMVMTMVMTIVVTSKEDAGFVPSYLLWVLQTRTRVRLDFTECLQLVEALHLLLYGASGLVDGRYFRLVLDAFVSLPQAQLLAQL